MKSRDRILSVLIASAAALVLASAPAAAEDLAQQGQFVAHDSLRLRADDVHEGDLYAFAATVNISGRQVGDIFTWTTNLDVSGEVEGDLVVGASVINISGRIGDTVRAFSGNVTVDGTIEGDLVVFGGGLILKPSGHVTGNVISFAARTTIDGLVDGDVTATGGEIELGGSVGRNATLEADVIDISPDARIEGDLTYTSRKELELASDDIVGGEVRFKEKVRKSREAGRPFLSPIRIGFRLWLAFSTLLIGCVLVALLRPAVPAVTETVERDALVAGLIGFGIALIVPAAALILMGLVIALPLGLITLGLYLIVMYLAKLPVAIWLGQRLLRLVGRADPSPYAGLVIGTIVLYALFSVPYLRWPAWLAAAFLGLGATILAARSRMQIAR